MQKALGIIGWIGTALVFGAVAIRMFYPERGISTPPTLAWAGLATVLIYMAGQWRDVADFYKGRGAKYGTLSIVSILVFLGILVAVNYLGTRQNKRWDFTANQVFSLSDQTVRILRELQEPATFTVYERQDRQHVHRDRLDEFTYHSSQVKTEFVDPDREPGRADRGEDRGAADDPDQHKGRTERVNSSNEQDLTNALIKAVTGQARKVYFTQGHGEKDLASSERTGYSTIAEAMKRDNYTFDSLVLITQKSVPDDATILVIAGPTTDFFPPEIEMLNAYVAKGGKVMVLLDPPAKAGATQPLLDAVPDGLGNQRRQRRRPRRQRHGPAARHRRVGAGRCAISQPSDHREPDWRDVGVPDGAVNDAGRGRLEQPHRATRADHHASELGRKRYFVAVGQERSDRVQCRQGRQAGADHAGRGGLGARNRDASEARQCQPRFTGCAEHA